MGGRGVRAWMEKARVTWVALLLGALCAWCARAEGVRVAVGAFETLRPDFTWRGERGSAAAWAKSFSKRLGAALVANGAQAGTGTNADVRVEGKIGFGFGGALVASVSYRAVEERTGKTVWEDVVRIESEAFAVTDLAALTAATGDAAAGTIAERTVANVVPYRIVSRDAGGVLAVAGGGGALCAGECLTVFAPEGAGEELGTVQIVEVKGREARALVVEGDAARMPVGSRLRRIPLVSPWTDGGENGKIKRNF